VQADLGWNLQVQQVQNKMRRDAARIRTEGRNVGTRARKTLYYAWVQSHLMCNSGAYLPLLSQNQMRDLQTAANAGVRAVCRLPKKGQAPLSSLREQLKIPSIEDLRRRVLWTEAWKRRPKIAIVEGPTTRGRAAGNVPVPDMRGWNGKRIQVLATAAWNDLPEELKIETDRNRAKKLIKRSV